MIERSVPGFDFYYATDDGQIINRKFNKRLVKTQRKNRYGYYYVNTYRWVDGQRIKGKICVHKLILLAFYGDKPFPAAQARHLDGDKENNQPSNLRWGTAQENAVDQIKHGTSHPPFNARGEKSYTAKISDADCREIITRFRGGEHYKLIAKDYPIHPQYVHVLSRGIARPDILAEMGIKA